MEILVATLIHTVAGRDTEGTERIRMIAETMRNAYGLISTRFYHGTDRGTHYLLLTTWEDEDAWHKVQERYNPKHLFLSSAPELLASPPEQWLMHYLWGYSRPSAEPTLADAHVATISPEQGERTQRGWIESLRRQAVQPMLTFAFLARGVNEEAIPPAYSSGGDPPYQHGSVFLNLLSWASEAERNEYYADANSQMTSRFLSSIGTVQVLPLEPMTFSGV